MKKMAIFFLSAAGLCMGMSAAHAQSAVERLDPALDALVGPETKVEKIYEEDQFFEGPVWHHGKDGDFLTFSDLISNRIDKWDPQTKQVTTYVADVWKGKDNTNAIAQERGGKKYVQVGANGETLDKEYPKATLKIVEEVTAVKDGKEVVDFYEALLVTAEKKEIEVQITADGKPPNDDQGTFQGGATMGFEVRSHAAKLGPARSASQGVLAPAAATRG